ncbi:TIGR04222 domain-containing membrane protein [Streptomyces sp. NPDC093546]|uniref:TIGR04222 domain-containing membrane protein n=1 Tax=Streptomyces sp. NPDC093546 TaxID=3366040 RepID=UPI0037F41DAD
MATIALVIVAGVLVSSAVLLWGTLASRPRGSTGDVHDWAEAAFLSGGPARVVDAAIAALHADGRLVVAGPGVVAVPRPVPRDAIERAVIDAYQAAPSSALYLVRSAAMRHPVVQEVGNDLAARGLLMPPGSGRLWRRWSFAQGMVCLLLLLAGIPVTLVQLMWSLVEDDPPLPLIVTVGPALAVGGVVALWCGRLAAALGTREGRAALTAYGRRHAHLGDPAHLVALRGVRAVPDAGLRGPLTAVGRMYGGGGSGSGSSSAALLADGAPGGVWCGGSDPGRSSCGSGSGCGSSTGSSCGSSGGSSSSCGSSGGSSCGSSGGSSCGGGSSS